MARKVRITHAASVLALAALAAACGGSEPAPVPPPAPPPPAPTAAAPAPAPSPAAATTAPAPEAKPEPKGPTPAVRYTGLSTPESVLYDEAADRYLVSNINGSPGDADGNGFISVLSHDGQVTNAKWIAGGTNKVKLDAPKGMAIAQGVLYVADLTNVRKFDLKTGAP